MGQVRVPPPGGGWTGGGGYHGTHVADTPKPKALSSLAQFMPYYALLPTSAAAAPWRTSHAGAGHISHSVMPIKVKFGGCLTLPISGAQHFYALCHWSFLSRSCGVATQRVGGCMCTQAHVQWLNKLWHSTGGRALKTQVSKRFGTTCELPLLGHESLGTCGQRLGDVLATRDNWGVTLDALPSM